jgi:hypothetical protein
MNNRECVVNVLASHREARQWTDEAVADDLLRQLDLDPEGEAKNAAPVVDPGISEDEVRAHEEAAKQATDKARAAREAFDAQREGREGDKAKAEADAREAERVSAEHGDPAMGQAHPAGEEHPGALRPMDPPPFIAAEPVPARP